MNKVMLMLSGGIDSTVMAYDLKNKGYDVYGVHINAGQPYYRQDRRSINLLSIDLGVPIQIIDIPGLVDSYKGYLQPEYEEQHQVLCERTRPFVAPLSIAGVFADIAGFDSLYIAYLKDEIEEFKSRYADLKQVHTHFENMINEGRKSTFKVVTPFMDKTKDEIIALGSQLGVPLEVAWSCWNNNAVHCGSCIGCTSRKAAFSVAKVSDTTKYLV